MLVQQSDFNIRRSLAGLSLPNCLGDHLDNEDKEKRAPTEKPQNRSGSWFIHFSLFLKFFCSLLLPRFDYDALFHQQFPGSKCDDAGHTRGVNRIAILCIHERLTHENCNDLKVTSLLLRESSERITQPAEDLRRRVGSVIRWLQLITLTDNQSNIRLHRRNLFYFLGSFAAGL